MIVSDLFIYPVKSAKGIRLDEMSFDSLGPLFDRRFMILDEENKMLTQRECPVLATLKTNINLERKELTLSYKEKGKGEEERITITLEEDYYKNKKNIDVQVWKDKVRGVFCEGDVDLFLTTFLRRKARLLFTSKKRLRPIPENEKHSMSFVDSSPLLIISEESLNDLNKRLTKPLTMDRFRPNIVLKGGNPFGEDDLIEYSMGEAFLKSFKKCSRCVMITIDQNEGVKSDTEPLKVLHTFRSHAEGIMFGVSAFNINGKKIKKGDLVETKS